MLLRPWLFCQVARWQLAEASIFEVASTLQPLTEASLTHTS
jgi:hypothetical protein